MSHRKRPRTEKQEPEPEPDGEADDDDDPRGLPAACLDSVVKLHVTHTEPNFSMPWCYRRQSSSTSSGFIISGQRLLTNAHCVDNYAIVKVKRRGDSTKFVAEVLAIGRECDLALLTVRDQEFWKGTRPISFGPLPHLQELVTVVGFPVGGDNVSITQGVVSRVEMQEYVHGCCELLAVQIDAAINPGNSGGPAFSAGNELVGVAFQSLKDGQTENIGYIIPTPVVRHFLEDVERHGRYHGFCELGIELQRCENQHLRAQCGMGPKQTGLMARRVYPTCSAAGLLQRGDVITHFDSVTIANDGTVPFRRGERISFTYLVSEKHVGEVATLRAIRNGRKLPPVTLSLREMSLLVPVDSRRRKPGATDLRVPSYAVVGGLVFTPLCEPYLRSEFGDDFDAKAPIALLERWQHGIRQAADDQIVILSQVLAHEINVGYEHMNNHIVLSLNDVAVRSLAQLLELVDANTERFLRIELAPLHEMIVLEASAVGAATAEVLAQHSIAKARSDDLPAGPGSRPAEPCPEERRVGRGRSR